MKIKFETFEKIIIEIEYIEADIINSIVVGFPYAMKFPEKYYERLQMTKEEIESFILDLHEPARNYYNEHIYPRLFMNEDEVEGVYSYDYEISIDRFRQLYYMLSDSIIIGKDFDDLSTLTGYSTERVSIVERDIKEILDQLETPCN